MLSTSDPFGNNLVAGLCPRAAERRPRSACRLGQLHVEHHGEVFHLGASYDLGVVKLFGNVATMTDMNPTIQPAPTVVAGAKGSSWLLGASAPLLGGSA